MKNARKIFFGAFICLLTACILGVTVYASTYQGINQEAGELYVNKLLLHAKSYTDKFPDNVDEPAEARTTNVIYDYVGDILKIKDYGDYDRSEEIRLLYNKGVSAGTLSWIYYSHHETLEDAPVRAVYEEQLAKIDGATDSSFLTAAGEGSVEDCYNALLLSIYSRKISDIGVESDSDAARAIITASLSSLARSCKYTALDSEGRLGEDAAVFKVYYVEVLEDVEIQRSRDRTSATLFAVLEALYPNDGELASEYFSAFSEELSAKTTASSMNTLLLGKLLELLDGLYIDKMDFRNSYLDQKKADVTNAVSLANESTPIVCAELAPLFEAHGLELYASDKKDILSQYAANEVSVNNYGGTWAERLDGIVRGYTEESGLFDLAESREAIDAELARAVSRLEWLKYYFETVEKISAYSGDNTNILTSVDTLYSEVDGEVASGSRDSALTLDGDRAKMDGYVICAEVLEFVTAHKDIIKKTDITSTDKTALSVAIADARELSQGAELLLDSELCSLGEKYKTATRDSLSVLLADDGASEQREGASFTLNFLIDSLAPKNNDGIFALWELKLSADGLFAKACALDKIYDVYAEEYIFEGREHYLASALEVLTSATEDMVLDTGNNIDALAEGAIAELRRLAALEGVYESAKEFFDIEGVGEILKNAEEGIAAYSTAEEIRSFADRKISDILTLIRLDAIENATSAIEDEAKKLCNIINDYKYITGGQRSELLLKVDTALEAAMAELEAAVDRAEALKKRDGILAMLVELQADCVLAEDQACLADAKSRLDGCYGNKEDYSADNYARLCELLGEYKSRLDAADGVPEYEAIRDEGIGKLLAIEDKLETAKRIGADKLMAEYNRLMQRSDCYSLSSRALLTEIYRHSVSEMSGFTRTSEIASLNGFIEERIMLMLGVYLDRLYTSDGYFTETGEPTPPSDYAPSTGSYYGMISSDGGILPDMSLSLMGADGSDITELIHKAAKDGLVVGMDGTLLQGDILRKLKRCELLGAVNVSLGGSPLVTGKEYTLSLLLPSDVELSEIIGVVFVRTDGSLEFFEVSSGQSTISFTTDHFSTYYIVSRGEVKLLPWIICLSILLVCELIIIALIFIRRDKRRKRVLYSVVAPLALSVRYTPSGGVVLTLTLATLVALFGAFIGYLAFLELMEKRKSRVLKNAGEQKKETKERGLCFVGAKEQGVAKYTKADGDKSEKGELSETKRALIAEPLLELIAEPLLTVSADEVDSLMSDGEAKLLQLEVGKYRDTEEYFGKKKAEINLDVISKNFEDGDTVTLNTLKEKKLVGSKVGAIKVLARGSIDKSLTVVAQEFSGAAVKMLLLTGGRAIITYPSKERKSRK